MTTWLRRWGWTLLVAACYLLFLDRGLNEPDEGRYAEIGREMVVYGDWFTPTQNGIPHFQKPPLIYWLTAVSLKTFGIHEWAARLPAALAALGTLALTAWISRMILGRGMRQAAVLVLAACAGFFALARLLTPDMLLTFWITAAIACAVKRHQGGGQLWGGAFFLAMGLGFMTKGPMALVVPMSAMLSLRWRTPRERRPSMPWATGLILTLVLGLWWFVVQAMVHDKLYDYFAGDELVKRFASGKHGRSKPIWFFFAVLPVAFLPWTFFLPALFRDLRQRWRAKAYLGPRAALLLGWFVPPLVVLSLSGSKLPTYILPLMPALALGVVVWWKESGRRTRLLHWIAAGALALFVVIASLSDLADPWLKQQSDTRDLAQIVKAQPDFGQATLFAARVRAQGFTFATGRLLCVTEDESDRVLKATTDDRARLFDDVEKLEAAMARLPVAYGIARREDVPKVFSAKDWRELGREGDFVLLGRNHDVKPVAPPPAAPSR